MEEFGMEEDALEDHWDEAIKAEVAENSNTEEGGKWKDDIEKHGDEKIDNVVRVSVEEIGEGAAKAVTAEAKENAEKEA